MILYRCKIDPWLKRLTFNYPPKQNFTLDTNILPLLTQSPFIKMCEVNKSIFQSIYLPARASISIAYHER
jgi:hypothetical protein